MELYTIYIIFFLQVKNLIYYNLYVLQNFKIKYIFLQVKNLIYYILYVLQNN